MIITHKEFKLVRLQNDCVNTFLWPTWDSGVAEVLYWDKGIAEVLLITYVTLCVIYQHLKIIIGCGIAEVLHWEKGAAEAPIIIYIMLCVIHQRLKVIIGWTDAHACEKKYASNYTDI